MSTFFGMYAESNDDLSDTDAQPQALNYGARDCLLSSGLGLEIAFQKHCQSKLPGEVNLLWFEDDSCSQIGSHSPFSDSGSFRNDTQPADYQVGLDHEVMDHGQCCVELVEDVVDHIPLPAIPRLSSPSPAEETTRREPCLSGFFQPILGSTNEDQGKPIKIYDISKALKFRLHSVEKPKKKEMKKLKKLLEPEWKSYTFSGTLNPTSKILLAAKLECIRLKESVATSDDEKIRLSEINVRLKAAFQSHLFRFASPSRYRTENMKNHAGYATSNRATCGGKSKLKEVEKVAFHAQQQEQVEGVNHQSTRPKSTTPIPRSLTATPRCTTTPDADTRFRVMIQAAGNNYVTNPGLMHRLKSRF